MSQVLLYQFHDYRSALLNRWSALSIALTLSVYFLTHRLNHIFLSVVVTFQNLKLITWPNWASSSPTELTSTAVNTILLFHKHLDKGGPHHCHDLLLKLKSFPPWHVAQICQRHQNAALKLLHAALPQMAQFGIYEQIQKPQYWCYKGSGTSPFCRPRSSSALQPCLCTLTFSPTDINIFLSGSPEYHSQTSGTYKKQLTLRLPYFELPLISISIFLFRIFISFMTFLRKKENKS